MDELTCQELVELVTDYFEGKLPPEQRARFEAHVAECPGCQIYLEQMRTTIVLTRAGGQFGEEHEFAPLMDAFRDWKRAHAES